MYRGLLNSGHGLEPGPVGRCGAVALVYPRNESFRRPLRYRFFDGVRLLAIPFDVTEPQSSVTRAIAQLETEFQSRSREGEIA